MFIVSSLPFLLIVGFIIFSCVKILNEYERAVVFRLGKFGGVRGPGLILLIPFVEKMQRVDLRTVTLDVPAQDIITKDNVTLKVNGVVYFKVSSPERAVISIENYYHATSQIAQTTLRTIIGQYELDEILIQRDDINNKLQEILDQTTEPWGIKVTNVQLKGIDLPESMQRVIGRQAEAERERRAKILSAEGEFMAAQKIVDAAKILSEHKDAITLRYLDTMREISVNSKNTATFFPLPIELLKLANKFGKDE
ncbi:MAG: slipin family protein [Bacteriovoracaceae bacterium]|nr:slipin family protein [Bacteriovoracaceae bacterium]